ncbi:MAG: PEP/pyruvate-binding domain-containing protein [bacterium]
MDVGTIGLGAGNPEMIFFGADAPDATVPVIASVGGKGINLCKMSLAGFPVPPGFVVTTQGYLHFVKANGLGEQIRRIAGSLEASDIKGVERASAEIRALFTEKPIPSELRDEMVTAYGKLRQAGGEKVAVRSSATAEDLDDASFAGQQDTYLNICGEEALLRAVKSCWGSLWTSRAMAYRVKQKIPMDGLALAVVVQQMVIADAAGVMFTVNPVTGHRDEMIINAAWGLGEAIVGGHVTPDTVIAEKATGKVKSIKVSEKKVMTVMTADGTKEQEITDERRHSRVLNDGDVEHLVGVGRKVEAYYKKAQDIEWAVAGGKVYLLQARPVTALPNDPAETARVRDEEIAFLKKLAGDQRRVWVLHNLNETLSAPTPLTWDIVKGFMSGNGGFGRMYRDFGYQPSKEVDKHGFLDLIGGHIYADTTRAADLFWDGMPLSYDPDAVVKNPKLMDAAPTRFDPERATGSFLLRLPRLLGAMRRCSKLTKKARREALTRFENDVFPSYREWVMAKRAEDLSKRSTGEVIRELDVRIDKVLNEFGPESLKPGFFGGIAQAAVEATLINLMGPEKGIEVVLTLTQGLDGDTTVEQSQYLWELARGKRTRAEFLDVFGHRTVEEMELARPRWREDDTYISQVLGAFTSGNVVEPSVMHMENAERRNAEERALPAMLAEWGGSSFLEEILADLKDAQALLPYREKGKHCLMMGYECIRLAIVELGKRWGLGRDVFFLNLAELKQFESSRETLMERLETRKMRWQAAKSLDMAEVLDSNDLSTLGIPKTYEATNELHGDAIAAGVSTGVAQIVHDPMEATGLCMDYVLVCHSTDPAWTALFVHARALVVEQGGILSHGAIVARDFGIPAIVCHDAMRRIPHGATIRVDGNRGMITIVKQPSRQNGVNK